MTDFEKECLNRCKAIATEMEAIYNGNLKKCPECGELIDPDDLKTVYRCPECGESVNGSETTCPHCGEEIEHEEITVCPCCGEEVEESELEDYTLWDYFSDCLDIEYRIGTDHTFRSVEIMITCGGPNIYVDTADAKVKLCWGNTHEEAPFSYNVRDEIDSIFEEYYSCC